MGNPGQQPQPASLPRAVDKMWWDYEPMLVYGCWRSRSPYQVAEPHPFSSAASKYKTGKVFHPTYDSYLTALCEGDYFYLGYKPVPSSVQNDSTDLNSSPGQVQVDQEQGPVTKLNNHPSLWLSASIII